MLIHQYPNYTISINSVKSLLHLTWHNMVDSDQFKEAFKKAIECAIEHRVQYWLSDNSIGIELDMTTQRWVAEQATKYLPKTCVKRFARVVPVDAFLQIVSYKVNERVSLEEASEFKFEVFSDVEQATFWLFEGDQISMPA